MRAWEIASIVFFCYIAAVALIKYASGRLRPGRALRVFLSSTAAIALAVASSRWPHSMVLHDWVLPPVLLLVAYWTSGLLFVAPMRRMEDRLMAIDRGLRINALAAGTPRWLAEVLELAYVGVYPLIPLALVLHLRFAGSPDPTRFWSVILVTDYICFGALPWIQTRPPRGLERVEPWFARIRALNLRLVGSASIGVNTFPSGHAAEAVAAALLVAGAPAPALALMWVNALAISAGAVLGRYHYAADAFAGWAVAVLVWFTMQAAGRAM